MIGADDTVYAVTQGGFIYAFDGNTLEERWHAAFGGTSFSASPTLDCARQGATAVAGPGTLFVPGASNGTVYAVIVDSHGLDSQAPWPKFQRDGRNSGNTDAAIVKCP